MDDVVDYQNFTAKDTTKAERKAWHIGDIWANQVKCNKCGDIIRSRNRHDMVYCKCGTVAVDGGSWYLKRAFKEEGDYEELSEYFDDVRTDEKENAKE
jgi:ribosomal protein L37AE/L43A